MDSNEPNLSEIEQWRKAVAKERAKLFRSREDRLRHQRRIGDLVRQSPLRHLHTYQDVRRFMDDVLGTGVWAESRCKKSKRRRSG